MKDHMTWDELMQKFSAVCKERDELHRTVNQLVKRLDDETAEVDRLTKENRAKEQYIAERMGSRHEA